MALTTRLDNTLDHLGDLILILEKPNYEDIGYVGSQDFGLEFYLLKQRALENEAEDSNGEETQSPRITEYRYRVSSRHLCLASGYFKAMLEGPWKESAGTSQNPGIVRITTYKNPTAFLLLMKILHGFHAAVPNTLPAGVLGDLTLMADFFQCLDRVAVFARTWLNNVMDPTWAIVRRMSESHHQYILAAWVFDHEEVFQMATHAAILYNAGPIRRFLPILPQSTSGMNISPLHMHLLLLQETDFMLDLLFSLREDNIEAICTRLNTMLVNMNRIMPASAHPGFTPLPESVDGHWAVSPWDPLPINPRERTLMQYVRLADQVLSRAQLFQETYGMVDEEFLPEGWNLYFEVEGAKRDIPAAMRGAISLSGHVHPHNGGWMMIPRT